MRSLEDARIVITGALGAIGRAATQVLTGAGARLVGIDLHAEPGVEAADVSNPDQIAGAIGRVAAELGGIDILINNAGIGCAHDSGDLPDASARRVIDVNFFGPWNATAAALPHLLESRGQVVNVSSGLAFVNVPYAAAYSASKRALDAYSSALRLEYGDRIAVTTVHPGYIPTAIHDGPRAAGATLDGLVRPDTVEQAGRAILRACAEQPRSVTTSRMSHVELWAARRLPRTVEKVLARRFRRWRATNAAPSFLRFPG